MTIYIFGLSFFYYLYQTYHTSGYIHLVLKTILPDLILSLFIHEHIPSWFFSSDENAIHILDLNTRLCLSP